ncbi:hypothetical protein ACC735_39600, partial [Rhizobium ruizarguesonis]
AREQKQKNLRKFEEIDPLLPLVGGLSRFRTKALLSRLSEIDRSVECSAATSSQEARSLRRDIAAERKRHRQPFSRQIS